MDFLFVKKYRGVLVFRLRCEVCCCNGPAAAVESSGGISQ